MSTMVLRLAAPMQSWGTDSKYNIRKTGREPSKSGVIGLLAAALGCKRDDTVAFAELSKLRFGVRADREGHSLRDFQMVHGKEKKDDTLTYRDYLCDAVFVVGLEGERALLERLQDALRHPIYPLFLGRRSCPPTGPLCLGIWEEGLQDTLSAVPWQVAPWLRRGTCPRLRVVLDTEEGFAQLQDVPVSFSPMRREYRYRNIKELWVVVADPDANATEHDPMAEL